jgi:hypothetical protein
MAIVAHLHHLFKPETCPSSIHTWRWQDRLLQCPRCQSHNVGPWDAYHYRSRQQRYRCIETACKRTFNDLTGTPLGRQQALCHARDSRDISLVPVVFLSPHGPRGGGHVRTGYRWCWWLRHAALSDEMERQLEGTVEADDLSHTVGQKGQAKQGGKKHIPPDYVVKCVIAQRKPPEVRICRLRNQSAVGNRPPSTSTPHCPACWARR